MKPKTSVRREVARLSEQLPKLTAIQKVYALRHCFKYCAIKRADGTNICTGYGHSWRGEHDLADTICGCTCPHYGMELEALRTRKSVFSENEYFSIVTTCKQYQVIRFFFVKSRYRAEQRVGHSVYEVVQRWISPRGITVTIARLRGISILYYDLWAEYSDMEARRNNKLRAYDINPVCTYPRQRFIPELKRNDFDDEYHNILPYDLFTAIPSNSRVETLLKTGQYPMLRHYIRSSFDMERSWASIKICIRNGYTIADGSMWRDTINFLRRSGKDTNSPKYVCPSDLKAEHGRPMHKHNRKIEHKKLGERIRQAEKHEKAYHRLKGTFFGIAFTDGTLQVCVLESMAEFAAEGTELHHCVFSNSYFLERNPLILSTTINGKRIETVEASLKTLEVVQSRGLHNSNTEYHGCIINLVNSSVNPIR